MQLTKSTRPVILHDTFTQLFVSGVIFVMNISTHTGYHTDTYRGTPYRIRTGVAAVKGQCPRPLDEGCILGMAPRDGDDPPSSVLETDVLPT